MDDGEKSFNGKSMNKEGLIKESMRVNFLLRLLTMDASLSIIKHNVNYIQPFSTCFHAGNYLFLKKQATLGNH